MDRWDRLAAPAARTRDRSAALAAVGRTFLSWRGDQALGFGPLSFLSEEDAQRWILFWTAARRVDDSVEAGSTTVDEWSERLERPRAGALADACVHALLVEEGPLPRTLLRDLFVQGLEGLREEERFGSPRGHAEYLRLLEKKSHPPMQFLDALLFPREPRGVRDAHAKRFAISAQLVDDCRDAHRDLARGRCFVTREEMPDGDGADPRSWVGTPAFAARRLALARRMNAEASAIGGRFRSGANRARSARLAAWWGAALTPQQVRPTDRSLVLEGRVGGRRWRIAGEASSGALGRGRQ